MKKPMISPLLSKKIWQSLAALFWTGLWIYGVGVLLACMLRWWPGDRLLPVRLVNYLMPWLLAGLLPGILLAWLAHRNLLALILAVPAIFICISYAPLFLPSEKAAAPDGMPLKVMSYNVWRENPDMRAVALVIGGEKPDIVLLQEIDGERLGDLIDGLSCLYEDELFTVSEGRIQQAVISRYPLEQLAAGWRKGRAQKVLATTPRGPVTVLNVHPLRWRWQRGDKEMAVLLAEDVVGAESPVILGGDFNTTDRTRTYRSLSRSLENAHWEAGRGFGFTYPSSSFKLLGGLSLPPLVRIDHIFYSRHFTVESAGTLPDSGGSDHLPVVAELVLESI